jgi:ethanolamine-phosphate cytidylyltransferase
VYIAGAWDLFNAGHAAALQEARKHGDFVLVGVYDDETVHRLHGRVSGAPVMNLFERALSVLACRYVDDVVMGAPLAVTQDLLRTFKVDLVMTGSVSEARASCLDDDVLESAVAVPRRLDMLRQFTSPMSLLSSDVIDRVLSKRDVFESRVRRKQVAEDKYREERVFMEEK